MLYRDQILQVVDRFADKIALICRDDRFTFGEIDRSFQFNRCRAA